MNKILFAFFLLLPLASFGQSRIKAFVGVDGGAFWPAAKNFKEVYPENILNININGGIGFSQLQAIVKFNKFSTEGVPQLVNFSASPSADWSQSSMLAGVRFVHAGNLDLLFDIQYYATNVTEKIRLNDPDFTILDRTNKLDARGFALGFGIQKEFNSYVALNLKSELTHATTIGNQGVGGDSVNLGYFFVGLGIVGILPL